MAQSLPTALKCCKITWIIFFKWIYKGKVSKMPKIGIKKTCHGTGLFNTGKNLIISTIDYTILLKF